MEIREGIRFKYNSPYTNGIKEYIITDGNRIKDYPVRNEDRGTHWYSDEMLSNFKNGSWIITYYPWEIGDWAYFTGKRGVTNFWTVGLVKKVSKVLNDTLYFNDPFYSNYRESFRPAFSHEIPKENPTSMFQVGKWYKELGVSGGWIAKFSDSEDHKFWTTEYISNTKQYVCCKQKVYFDYTNKVQICSLEEIQPYLPEGHPDKILKIINRDNIVCIKITEGSSRKDVWYNEYIGQIFKAESMERPKNPSESGADYKIIDFYHPYGEIKCTNDKCIIVSEEDYLKQGRPIKNKKEMNPFEEEIQRQEQILALNNKKTINTNPIQYKDEEGITKDAYKKMLYGSKGSYEYFDTEMTSNTNENKSTIGQIKKRTKKVQYSSTVLIIK